MRARGIASRSDGTTPTDSRAPGLRCRAISPPLFTYACSIPGRAASTAAAASATAPATAAIGVTNPLVQARTAAAMRRAIGPRGGGSCGDSRLRRRGSSSTSAPSQPGKTPVSVWYAPSTAGAEPPARTIRLIGPCCRKSRSPSSHDAVAPCASGVTCEPARIAALAASLARKSAVPRSCDRSPDMLSLRGAHMALCHRRVRAPRCRARVRAPSPKRSCTTSSVRSSRSSCSRCGASNRSS